MASSNQVASLGRYHFDLFYDALGTRFDLNQSADWGQMRIGNWK